MTNTDDFPALEDAARAASSPSNEKVQLVSRQLLTLLAPILGGGSRCWVPTIQAAPQAFSSHCSAEAGPAGSEGHVGNAKFGIAQQRLGSLDTSGEQEAMW